MIFAYDADLAFQWLESFTSLVEHLFNSWLAVMGCFSRKEFELYRMILGLTAIVKAAA